MQLREGPLNFMPTYKYDNGTNTYDSSEKERTPSWTDRILFSGDCVEQLDYNRAELLMSDHRPVTSVFQIRVKKVDVNKKAALQQDIQKLVLSGNVNTDIVVHTKRISNRKPTTAMLIDISESSPISVTPEAPYNPFDDDFDVRFGGIQKPSTENDNWWDRPFDVEAIKFEGNSSNPFFVL